MNSDDLRASLATFNDDALAMFGKPILQCTLDQLREMAERFAAESTQLLARMDQTRAALNDLERSRCRCDVMVAVDEHGQLDVSRVRVDHVCGR